MPDLNQKPFYLFVCVENACRSQMAEGLLGHLTDCVTAGSAGMTPADVVDSMAVTVMKERGIDISTARPKALTPDMTERATRVITMGCSDGCPYAPPEKLVEWDIPDPRGKGEAGFIAVRDQIETRISDLFKTEEMYS